ncbi:MAG: hypothetical protein ACKOOD_01055 [Microbacteriaceae bacterium]
MVIRINPARQALWRDATTLQIGLGRESVVLPNLDEQHERLIRLLYSGVPDRALSQLSDSVGLRREETEKLMTRLRPMFLDEPKERLGTDEVLRQRFAEIIRASFQYNTDPDAVFARRSRASIEIVTLNQVTITLASALASAGITTIESLDDSPVEPDDLGPLMFQNDDLGSLKNQALQKKLFGPRLEGRRSGLSISIQSANHPLTESDFATAGRGQSMKLAIELAVHESRVSPLMRAGETPCLDCRNAIQASADPAWAPIMSQLRGRDERLDDAQTSMLCAGFALEEILRTVDGVHPATFEGRSIDHRTGLIRLETWLFDKQCRCRSNQTMSE